MWARGYGLRDEPGMPQTGWQQVDVIALGDERETCQWCLLHQSIRNVHVMSHPGYPDMIRVGNDCAASMMGYSSSAAQFERELPRELDHWQAPPDDGGLMPVPTRSTIPAAVYDQPEPPPAVTVSGSVCSGFS
jgi:hypothetical protein